MMYRMPSTMKIRADTGLCVCVCVCVRVCARACKDLVLVHENKLLVIGTISPSSLAFSLLPISGLCPLF